MTSLFIVLTYALLESDSANLLTGMELNIRQ
jgi:hypothetical protein